MVASEILVSESSRGGAKFGPPKLSAFATFHTWLLMFKIFLLKLGSKFTEIFVTPIPEDESEDGRDERLKEYETTNWTTVSYIADACSDNEAAMAVFSEMANNGIRNIWTTTLISELEKRLDQKTDSKMANLMRDWGALSMVHRETGAEFIDRVKKLINSIRLLDSSQVPLRRLFLIRS